MIEIILKNNVDKSKMDALILFLKALNIDAELKKIPKAVTKSKPSFTLSAGIWKDYSIDANKLRQQAWNRNK
ncbi:MAG TPA: hypothetical protein VN726_14685 [Hanamia sp.]|nr:hypothetical protein [Hanamia sp.]